MFLASADAAGARNAFAGLFDGLAGASFHLRGESAKPGAVCARLVIKDLEA
jgi:hypothetical protein